MANLKLKLNNPRIKEYPELESLTVIPTLEKQTFKPNKYGYSNVIVEKMAGTNLNIEPTVESQEFEGLYSKVNVAGDENLVPENIKNGSTIFGVTGIPSVVNTDDATATAEDIIKDKTAYINGEKITGTKEIVPRLQVSCTEIINYEAGDFLAVQSNTYYHAVQGDIIIGIKYDELTKTIGLNSDQIVQGETVLGIEGTASAGTDTTDATATASDMAQGTTAYVNGEKITGTIPVRKAETIEQTSWVVGGNGAEIYIDTQLPEKSIVDTDVVIRNKASQDLLCGMCTVDATATAEDIAEGKTAYVKGERIVGTASAGEDISEYFLDTFTGGGSAGPGIIHSIKKLPDDIVMKSHSSCSYAFSNMSALEYLPKNLDTSTATTMDYMCEKCKSLKEVPSTLNTENVTNMNHAFNGCTTLASFPKLNTSKVTNFTVMISGCENLVTVASLDMSSAIKITNCFLDCNALENFGGCINLGKAYTQKTENYSNYTLKLSSSTLLTHDSLMNVINNLYDLNLTYDVANGGTLYTQQLVLGATNLAKLTEEEIAIAQNKGWSVS